MSKKRIAFVLGIRPDIIRASLILKYLKSYEEIETEFIWSGQHYSDNLKGIFLRELEVDFPAIELGATGETDAEIVSSVIAKLYKVLEEIRPEVVVFLGDTNTVISCIAAAQLNIPIVHIEGGMRSYDWRMPEEKYRTVSDHLADLIYVYSNEYKEQAIREGINPNNIVVVGNPIVDIINKFYFEKKGEFKKMATDDFFKDRGIKKNNYYVLSWHRRENVHEKESFNTIINLLSNSPFKVYFPASYRTKKVIKEAGVSLPENIIMDDPIGYYELLTLMVNSRGILTDSGTIVEEASILQVPCVQMRRSTERPQVYDVGGCVKFDPTTPLKYPVETVFKKLESLFGKKWKHNLGDGKTSERIAKDLKSRVLENRINGHKKEQYNIPVERSYKEDEIKL